MNLILTPVYMAFDRVQQMCRAIDENSTMPFIHILIDDNSSELPPIKVTENRKWIIIRDVVEKKHNNLGRALQVGLDYAHHQYSAIGKIEPFQHLFLIESDVMVQKNWDKQMLEIASQLTNWATLDTISVSKENDIVYPTNQAHRLKRTDELDEVDACNFQCTLFSEEALDLGWKFSDFPDHFDILISRCIKAISNLKFYRARHIKVVHYPHSSRIVLTPHMF